MTDVVESTPFRCPICGDRWGTIWGYTYHWKTHSWLARTWCALRHAAKVVIP